VRLILLLILLPALDLALCVILAGSLPRPLVLAWLAAASIAGGFLILKARKSLRLPRAGALDLALSAREFVRLAAGLLLLFPGPLSDLVAAILLVPRSRQRLTTWLLSRALGMSLTPWKGRNYEGSWPRGPADGAAPAPRRKDEYVRDAEFEVVSDGEEPSPEVRRPPPDATKPKG